MNSTRHIPDTDKIHQLNRQKSGFLLRAQRLQKNGEANGETTVLFSKAAEIEVQIADFLEKTEHEKAIIHQVSAASCYMRAKNYQRALELFNQILARQISQKLRRDVETFRDRCHAKLQKVAQ